MKVPISLRHPFKWNSIYLVLALILRSSGTDAYMEALEEKRRWYLSKKRENDGTRTRGLLKEFNMNIGRNKIQMNFGMKSR